MGPVRQDARGVGRAEADCVASVGQPVMCASELQLHSTQILHAPT